MAMTKDERARRKTVGAAEEIASKLAAMDKGDDIAEFGPRILDLMRGVPTSVWIMLDEKPGLFGYMNDRFYMLRRVRNNPEFGRQLFASLKKD